MDFLNQIDMAKNYSICARFSNVIVRIYKYNGNVKAIAMIKVKGINIHQYFILSLMASGI